MCMAQTPQPVSAASGSIAGSPASAVTSLMISAPASIAHRATAAFEVSIDTGTSGVLAQFFDNRHNAAKFFFGIDRQRAGARAFAADVEEVGALGGKPQTVLDGGFRIEETPTVGEAVRRNVDDSHQPREPAERKRARAEFPVIGGAGRHVRCLRSDARGRRKLSEGESPP